MCKCPTTHSANGPELHNYRTALSETLIVVAKNFGNLVEARKKSLEDAFSNMAVA